MVTHAGALRMGLVLSDGDMPFRPPSGAAPAFGPRESPPEEPNALARVLSTRAYPSPPIMDDDIHGTLMVLPSQGPPVPVMVAFNIDPPWRRPVMLAVFPPPISVAVSFASPFATVPLTRATDLPWSQAMKPLKSRPSELTCQSRPGHAP